MIFEPLNAKKHDRLNFDCGVEALNLYLQRFANQDQKRSLTRVYVLVNDKNILGYYSISAHSVSRDDLPDDIQLGSYNDIPFLLLGRLAVDKKYQGQGYGDALIYHSFQTTVDAAEKIGILGMIVDSKNEDSTAFYEGFGFKRLLGTTNRFVLPISIISSLIYAPKAT
jgi:ribosomal protein S18 acetylase RimI-like enzyme